MKINPNKLALATMLSTSILWTICISLVILLPNMMLLVSSHMLHLKLEAMGWEVSALGALIGLVSWAISGGLFAWILGHSYNRIAGGSLSRTELELGEL